MVAASLSCVTRGTVFMLFLDTIYLVYILYHLCTVYRKPVLCLAPSSLLLSSLWLNPSVFQWSLSENPVKCHNLFLPAYEHLIIYALYLCESWIWRWLGVVCCPLWSYRGDVPVRLLFHWFLLLMSKFCSKKVYSRVSVVALDSCRTSGEFVFSSY